MASSERPTFDELAETPTPSHRIRHFEDEAGENALVGFESEHLGVLVWADEDVDEATIETALEDLSDELTRRAGGHR